MSLLIIDAQRANNTDDGVIQPNIPSHISSEFIGVDDPRDWKQVKKWICTVILATMTALIALCSSIYTAATSSIAKEFNVSREVSTLGVTTFLLGFGTGPLLFAPLSEIMSDGRSKVFQVTLLLFVLLQLGCALAPNIETLLCFRYLAGFFGSPTVTNSGGALTDIWEPSQRSVPLALFSAASFLGPVIAPIIGGFLTTVSWRWNFWTIMIASGAVYLAMMLLLPETYRPLLIARKADVTKAKHDTWSTLRQAPWSVSLTRPVIMLCTEPILFSLSLYMALIFGILYLDFGAYPIVFTQTRRWEPQISGLAFLGIASGMAIATAVSPLINRLHARAVARLGPIPEARLPHLIILSWLIPVSLFWFAWTADPPVPWVVPVVSGVFFGLGLVPLFLGITAYLTDCYGDYSASALAANAVLRSLFGAVFPLFTAQMYEGLGTPWATSLLGFLAAGLAPLPFVFYVYGSKLRSMSAFHLKTMAATA